MATLFIYTSINENITDGLKHGVWGMVQPDGSDRAKGDGMDVLAGDLVVLMTGLVGQVRRGKQDESGFDVWTDWAADIGTESGYREVDMVVAVAGSGVRRDERPLWTNEEVGEKSRYPWRFELAHPISLGRVAISPDNFTTAEAAAIRSSAVIPAPVRLIGSSGALLSEFGAEEEGLERKLETVRQYNDGRRRGKSKPYGRDAVRNAAVEQRAVTVATEFYRREGYEVRSREAERGLGYDLECLRADGPVHLEVKGTVGDGAEVIVTRNEAQFARDSGETARLFIVARIEISSDDDDNPIGRGGDVVHNGPWLNLDSGLTATQYLYAR